MLPTLQSLPKQSWFLLAIVFVAIFLRFWKLGQIPNGVNRDEASLGYTAYSLLQTGRDEYGMSWPINVQSFGDWKLPVYIYLTIPSVIVFGLTEFSVRLPSALAGVGCVLAIYWLVKLVIDQQKKHHWFPLVAAGMMAISPWSVHLSRVAYEANVALFFCLWGTVFGLLAIKQQKNWLLPVSGIFLGLTVIGYHAFQIFTPLLILWSLWIFREPIVKLVVHNKTLLVLTVALFLIPGLVLFFGQGVHSNQVKYSGLSIFSPQKNIEQRAQENLILQESGLNWLRPVYSSRPVFVANTVFLNLFSIFDPDFLFLHGGNHGSHNVPGVGNLYWFEIITLSVAVYQCLKEKKSWQVWILGWLGLAVVAPTLTIEANHSVRFFPGVVPFVVLSAFGIYTLVGKGPSLLRFSGIDWSVLQTILQKKTLIFITSAVVLISVLRFFITYFYIDPVLFPDRWPWFMKDLVVKEQLIEENFDQVYMQGETSSPYIYFLFYQPWRTLRDEQTIERYLPTNEGFVHVKEVGKLKFGQIDWQAVRKDTGHHLLIVRDNEIPADVLEMAEYKVLDTISRPHSDIKYYLLGY